MSIVGAYALVSFSILKSGDFWYQFLNLTGSVGIVLISLNKKAYQPAVLNIIWAVIALIAVFNILR